MNEVLALLLDALRLEPTLFQGVRDAPLGYMWPALGVALIAGVSTMLGHLAILSLNRIRGFRLLASLTLSGVVLAALHVIQMVITWFLLVVVLQRSLDLLPLVVVGLLALAPQSLSFITAFPHLGMLFGRVIGAWSYLVIIVGVAYSYRLEFGWALGFTLVGWLVMQLLSRMLQRPVNWLFAHVWTMVTGRPTMLTSSDILAGAPIIPVTQREGSAA